ncbi:MAG: nucleotidyl transferase AbiEii/AbiGii toxin family protein [Desulfobacteraceae bacterium]|nr:nucleotidyl transferase AbiEii/AbiGii toxin family protein [Desulfobacteraceae bacterium]
MPEKYYPNKLYPFQDEVLQLIQTINSSFYLTGGTVLSRCYLNHRYSDDLDFFMNSNPDFKKETRLIIDSFKKQPGWILEIGTVSESFVRLALVKDKVSLKIDFVNDVGFHAGSIETHPLFHRIDNCTNILSNKLCAISRMDVKDLVDILFISKTRQFNWNGIVKDAREKDLWVEPLELCRIIKDFPLHLLNTIKWVDPVNTELLSHDIHLLHDDIFFGRDNSLELKK